MQPPRLNLVRYHGRVHDARAALHQFHHTLLPGAPYLHCAASAIHAGPKPCVFSGQELEINYATSAGGSIRVELQDEAGLPIPGYAAADCNELIGDEIERVVAWQGRSAVGSLAGNTVRLRYVMKDADVYSFRFRDGEG